MEPGEQEAVRSPGCERARDATTRCIEIFSVPDKDIKALTLAVEKLVGEYGKPDWRKVLWWIVDEQDTPLHYLQFISHQGVNPNTGVRGEDYENALIQLLDTMVSMRFEFSSAMKERVKFLVEKGANINLRHPENPECSPVADILHKLLSPSYARRFDDALDTVRFLVALGADVNMPDYNGVIGGPGKTPLMFALGLKDPDCMLERVELLLELGANCEVSYMRDNSTGNLITPCDRVRKRIEKDSSNGKDVGVLQQVLELLEGRQE